MFTSFMDTVSHALTATGYCVSKTVALNCGQCAPLLCGGDM